MTPVPWGRTRIRGCKAGFGRCELRARTTTATPHAPASRSGSSQRSPAHTRPRCGGDQIAGAGRGNDDRTSNLGPFLCTTARDARLSGPGCDRSDKARNYAGRLAAIAGGGASAFFFYRAHLQLSRGRPATFDRASALRLRRDRHRPSATNLGRQAELARRRETEVHDLYAFSRRLAAARTASDIYTAIREHLAAIIGRRTILFETAPRGAIGATLSDQTKVPELVKRATEALAAGRKGHESGTVADDGEGHAWLLRKVSGKTGDFGVLAIDVGQRGGEAADAIMERVDAVLGDATAYLGASRSRPGDRRGTRALRNRGAARSADRVGFPSTAHAAGLHSRRGNGNQPGSGQSQRSAPGVAFRYPSQRSRSAQQRRAGPARCRRDLQRRHSAGPWIGGDRPTSSMRRSTGDSVCLPNIGSCWKCRTTCRCSMSIRSWSSRR